VIWALRGLVTTRGMITISQAAGWLMMRVRRDITEEVLLTR
jgi:hypothetical protein